MVMFNVYVVENVGLKLSVYFLTEKILILVLLTKKIHIYVYSEEDESISLKSNHPYL